MCIPIEYFKFPLSINEFIYRLIRGVLYTFTFILCILGLSLILFSFWYIYEGKNYHLDSSMKFCVFTVAFMLGFILLSLAMCGLAGVFNENFFLAKIFLIGLAVLMLVEIACIFLVYSYKHEILLHANSLFKKFISVYNDDGDIKYLVDTIQSDLKCCGISSPNDWDINPYYKCSSISTYACSVPASCCYHFALDKPKFNLFCGLGIRRNDTINKSYQSIHVTGCKYSIYTFLDYKHKLTSYILAGILVPQVIGVLLIVGFLVSLNNLMRLNSIEHSSSTSSASSDETTITLENIPCKSKYFNKDVFCVNNQHNYIVKFDRDYTTNHCKIQPYKKKLEPLPQEETKKNLFILSIGSNNEFIKRANLKCAEQNEENSDE